MVGIRWGCTAGARLSSFSSGATVHWFFTTTTADAVVASFHIPLVGVVYMAFCFVGAGGAGVFLVVTETVGPAIVEFLAVVAVAAGN